MHQTSCVTTCLISHATYSKLHMQAADHTLTLFSCDFQTPWLYMCAARLRRRQCVYIQCEWLPMLDTRTFRNSMP
jgi:hypothetical protein